LGPRGRLRDLGSPQQQGARGRQVGVGHAPGLLGEELDLGSPQAAQAAARQVGQELLEPPQGSGLLGQLAPARLLGLGAAPGGRFGKLPLADRHGAGCSVSGREALRNFFARKRNRFEAHVI
jgi:hypothetical protein